MHWALPRTQRKAGRTLNHAGRLPQRARSLPQFQIRPYQLTSCIPIRSHWEAPGGRSWRPASRQPEDSPRHQLLRVRDSRGRFDNQEIKVIQIEVRLARQTAIVEADPVGRKVKLVSGLKGATTRIALRHKIVANLLHSYLNSTQQFSPAYGVPAKESRMAMKRCRLMAAS